MFPTVFILCCFAVTSNEIYYSHRDCSDEEALGDDVRWFLRSGILVAMPLTFAMTMDGWPPLGNALKLSFESNMRRPPLCGRWECIIPSLLVGLSVYFFIYGACWLHCAPDFGITNILLGIICIFAGFGFSCFLRRQKCETPFGGQDSIEVTHAKSDEEADEDFAVAGDIVAPIEKVDAPSNTNMEDSSASSHCRMGKRLGGGVIDDLDYPT